jgi:hypothetical protein
MYTLREEEEGNDRGGRGDGGDDDDDSRSAEGSGAGTGFGDDRYEDGFGVADGPDGPRLDVDINLESALAAQGVAPPSPRGAGGGGRKGRRGSVASAGSQPLLGPPPAPA